jgi:NAD-dependent deacetylase
MKADPNSPLPDTLLHRLMKARNVLVLSGAGMSAESGIPTFRDAQTGFWSKYKPEELATPQAFANDPTRVWSWYEERRAGVRKAQPHAGHRALVQLESILPNLSIVTQNVDSLHQRSGSSRVIELHGNIMRSVCHLTGKVIDEDWLLQSDDLPPRSPWARDGLARPDVVWFGETLPAGAMNAAMEAAVRCDFCFSIGTTSLVQPAASLPIMALEHGASLVEINPQETPLSLHADLCLRGTASEQLTALVRQIEHINQIPEQ